MSYKMIYKYNDGYIAEADLHTKDLNYALRLAKHNIKQMNAIALHHDLKAKLIEVKELTQ